MGLIDEQWEVIKKFMLVSKRQAESKPRPNEADLARDALQARFVKAEPERLIDDKTYDNDRLDRRLKAKGIRMIARIAQRYLRPRLCADLNGDGRLKGWLLGFKASGVWLSAMGNILRTTLVSLACIIISLENSF